MGTDRPAAGYSGTPLSQKLGIKPGHRFLVVGAFDGFQRLLEPLPPGVTVVTTPRGTKLHDIGILFVEGNVKVCAIDGTWSGLAVVRRLEHRGKKTARTTRRAATPPRKR